MSILDITEEQIFQTLGRGRDPNFKPRITPATKPEKDTVKQSARTTQSKNILKEPVKSSREQEVEASILMMTESLCELNHRLNSIQKKVIWYTVPQYMLILVILLVLFVKI